MPPEVPFTLWRPARARAVPRTLAEITDGRRSAGAGRSATASFTPSLIPGDARGATSVGTERQHAGTTNAPG